LELLFGVPAAKRRRSRTALVRFSPDGTIDESFDAGFDQSEFPGFMESSALILVLDGNIFFAGGFASVNGVPQPFLVRPHGDPPLRIGISGLTRTGAVGLTVNSLPRRVYVLGRSKDLWNWTPVRTNTAASYEFDLSDVISPSEPRRFYRIRQQQ
jgi:hypothetical protein